MVQSTSNQDLLKILVAVAWIDGEIQPAEKTFLEQIATEQNLESAVDLQTLLAEHQDSSLEKCYQLLEQYLGRNPNVDDYDHLLSSVSKLVYSDNDIATEEASLLTKIQNLDPNNLTTPSTFDKAIAKIQKIYQQGLNK
ncbi:MAG: TerB family tellurite resistance protein [Cyanobacteria bacterium J06600_6]